MTTPRLTDHQLSIVLAAAQPLQPADREPFLVALAAELGQFTEIGDGNLHRAIARVQPRFFSPPSTGDAHYLQRCAKPVHKLNAA